MGETIRVNVTGWDRGFIDAWQLTFLAALGATKEAKREDLEKRRRASRKAKVLPRNERTPRRR